MQSATPGTHMDYVYEMARVLHDEEKLPLTLILEKGSISAQPKWVIPQKFHLTPLRIIENFLLICSLRFTGHKTFYIHYSFLSAISAGIITKLFGGTVYYWNAGMPWQYKRPWVENLYQKLAFKMIDYLVTGAGALIPGYCDYYKILPDRVKVIPNWIDLSKINIDLSVRGDFRAELGIPESAPVLLFVQKLAKRKGAHLLPEIFDKVKKDSVHLIIAGDGPEENFLKKWKEQSENKNRIHMTGRLPRNRMQELYQTADVFLLPSEEEGSPHSLIEAMAYGLPFVGFSVGGVAETSPPELKRHLHEFGNIEGMVESINLFLSDPAEIKSVKECIKKWVPRFDKGKAVESFKELLLDS